MPQHLRLVAFGAMVLVGLAWGLSMPLSKIAVSTGYRHFGLIFWQLLIGSALLSLILVIRGRALPRGWPQWRTWLVLSLSGSLIPSVAFYAAVVHLPAGVMSIIISLVPVMAFPIAMGLGLERFSAKRIGGLLLGLAGTLLLILPGPGSDEFAGAIPLLWIGIALVAPLCYAIEGNYVARCGTAGLDPFQVMWGASLMGAILVLPAALATGQFISPLRPFGAPETAIATYGMISVLAYSGYVWLVGAAGAVFAIQVSYLVTAFGVIASSVVLDERYSPNIWVALGLVMIGVFLVQPQRQRALAETSPIGETGSRVS